MFVRIVGCVFAAFAFGVVDAMAQQASVFSFMRYGLSARHAALGGATNALTNDPSTVVLNPATLTTVEGTRVSATVLKHVLDINSGLAVYSTELESGATIAATAVFSSYGSFDRADEQGTRFGSFGANDVAFGVSYANEIDTMFSYGATVKFLYSGVADMSSTAVALDAGLLVRFPATRTNIAISASNLGVQLSTFDGTSDRLPVDVRIGLNHRLRGLPLLVNVSLKHLADDVPTIGDRLLNFSVGGELYVGKAIQLRLGYDHASRNTTGVPISTQLTGLSGGIGVNVKTIGIDYALSTFGSAALLHRLSVGIRLPSGDERP
jgi:hypothetical protein